MSTTSAAAPPLDELELVDDGIVEDATRRAEFARARHHRFILGLAVAVILGTFLLQVRPDQRVAVRGLAAFPLPELCGTKLLWGFECPACGLTRSFIFAGRGDWLRALELNRVGFLMMLAVVAQLPYRLTMLSRLRRGTPIADSVWPKLAAWTIIAALIVNWGLKLVGI